MTNYEQIRKDFEEWMGDGGLSPRAIGRNSKGDYILMQAASAWEVWKAAHTHYAKSAAPLNVWQQAIDAELVSAHLGVAHNDATFEGAQKAINELICWHIDVATDPATNGGQRLTDAKPIVLPEPVAAQVRFKPENDTAWSSWKICAVEDAREIEAYTLANGWGYEVRYLHAEQQVRELLARDLGVEPQPQADALDAAFEAVRKKLCKLQRYSFWLDEHGGGVQRVKDRCGNWIGFDAAHELFDTVAIDAAIAAARGEAMNTNTIFPLKNEQGIELTKRAIEREESKIAAVNSVALPKPIQDLIEAGELTQWRRHPTIFFVEGVGKARIIWDSEKGIVAHRYLRDIPKDQYPKFRDVFNKLSADIAARSVEGGEV